MENLELYDIAGIYAVATYYSAGESLDHFNLENELLEESGIGVIPFGRNTSNCGDTEVIKHYFNAVEEIERCDFEIEIAESELLEDNSPENIAAYANAVLNKEREEKALKNDYVVIGGDHDDRLICDVEEYHKYTGNQYTGEKLREHLKLTLDYFMAYVNGDVTSVVVQEQDPGFDWEEFAEDPILNSESGSFVAPVGYVIERNLPKQLLDWGLIAPIGKHHKAKEVNL